MSILAGYACADITPAAGDDLSGFAARTQPATSVAAPLLVRVVVLAVGRRRAVIAVCDTLGFTIADSQRLERRLATAARVPVRSVMLCCTHTHAGAMAMPLGLVGRFDPAYVALIADRLAAAATAAAGELQPVTRAVHGGADISAYGAFRCAVEEPGRDHWPGKMQVLQLRRAGAPPITLALVGVHPYVLGWRNRRFHPDYPGAAGAAMSKRFGGPALVLPGAAADIAPVPGFTNSLRKVENFGRGLAQLAETAIRSGDQVELTALQSAVTRPRVRFGFVATPTAAADEAAMATADGDTWQSNTARWRHRYAAGELPASSVFPIHVLRLGPLVLVGLAAEVFYDTGADLAAAFPDCCLWTLAQAGGNLGYLPRPFAYKHRTYEAASAYEWYDTAGAICPAAEPQLRAAAAATVRNVL